MSSNWSVELESQTPAVHLFRAMFNDWQTLGPKLLPDIFYNISAPLTFGYAVDDVRQINFTQEMPFSYVNEKIDFVDPEKFEVKISVIDGGNLGKKFNYISTFYKIEPKGTGSIAKLEGTYDVIPGNEVSEDFQKTKEIFINSVKAVEEYIQANPDTCLKALFIFSNKVTWSCRVNKE